jgi:WD40 repeat protein
MRITNTNKTLLLPLFASILASTAAAVQSQPPEGDTAKKEKVVAKRVFFLPPDAVEITDKAGRLRENKAIWIRAGGTVTDPLCPGPFFVDSGGTFSGSGNRHVVIVKKGGKVSAIGGRTLIFYEKGADVSGASVFPGNTLIAYDAVTFEKLEAFTLEGTVFGVDGKPAGGVKVHAYDVGKLHLESTAAQADGTFVFRPKREVAYLVADFSPRWAKKARDPFRSRDDLEFRLHVRPLQGWDMAVAEGSWAKDATVKLLRSDTARLRVEPLQELKTQTHLFALSMNNKALATMDYSGGISLWDVQTGNLTKRIIGPQRRSHALAYSPDGKLIAVSFFDGTVGLWQATTGAKVRDLESPKGNIMCCAFAPDNKTLVSGSADGFLVTWDLVTGKLLHSVKAYAGRTTFVTFSPDGKTLLTAGESLSKSGGFLVDQVRLWDVSTGKQLCVVAAQGVAGAISPNGRIVAANDYVWRHFVLNDKRSVSTRYSSIVLASGVTGKELFRLANVGNQMVFSPDGRILMVATTAMTSSKLSRIHYYEVATGQEIFSVPLPDRVMKTSWGSGGRLLATTALSDSSVRLWDLRPSHILLGNEKDTSPKVLDQLWSDLAADDAALAHQAIWKLSAAPEKAVVFLKSRLQPIPVKEVPLARLVAELDSEVFTVREKASQELKKLGTIAEDYVRHVAKDNKLSLEKSRRLKAILDSLERLSLGREELRQVRAIQVLETIASPQAGGLLETLARGWSAGRQTVEARESLQRMKQQLRPQS